MDFSDRTDKLADRLGGITQRELAARLGVSPATLFAARSGGPISRKTLKKLAALEAESFPKAARAAEDPAAYGSSSIRQLCEKYFRARLDEAEALRERGGYAVLYRDLVKFIPENYLDDLINLPEIDLGDARAGETESPRRKSS